MTRFRTIAAFLVAPLIIPFGLSSAMFSVTVAFSPRISPAIITDFINVTSLFSRYALPVAYIVELVLGFPAWLLFHRRGIRGWSAFALGGAVIGLTYFVAYAVAEHLAGQTLAYDFMSHPFTKNINPGPPWLAILAGLAAALLFRAIAIPNQFEEKPRSFSRR